MKIGIENFRGKLRIRFIYQGERECIALGISDSPTSRAYAEQIVKTIELDILSNNLLYQLHRVEILPEPQASLFPWRVLELAPQV